MASTVDSLDFNADNVSTFVSVGEHKLSISLHGPPRTTKTDPLLILIPGTAGTTAKWPALVRALSPFIRILSFDRPGLGDSDLLPTNTPPTLTSVSNDLRALLSATNLQAPYILLGHSWGGMLSTFFAAALPSPSVLGLILLDSGAPSHPPLPTYDSFATDPGTPFANPSVLRTFQRQKPPSILNMPLKPETCALTPDEIDFLQTSTSTPKHKKAAALEFQGLLDSYLPFLEKGWLSPIPNGRYTTPKLSGVKVATLHAHAYLMFERLYFSVYGDDKVRAPDDESFETDKAVLADLLTTWKDRVRENQEQFANLTEENHWLALDPGEDTEHDVMVTKEGVDKVREVVKWMLNG
jgi:pimeloyl-ACP methyl ester carboxylesterase